LNVIVDCLRIQEDVVALLVIHSGDPIAGNVSKLSKLKTLISEEYTQKIALKSQSHWCLWLYDSITSFANVDIKDGLTSYLLGAGLGSKCGHQPA
jgi:hypothetical protein